MAMITNSSMTVYHYAAGAYARTFYPSVHWYSKRISNVTDNGVAGADMISIRIPMEEVPDCAGIRKNDIVAKGDHPAIETLEDLMVNDKGKVAEISVNEYGLNPHIRISAEA